MIEIRGSNGVSLKTGHEIKLEKWVRVSKKKDRDKKYLG